MNPISTNTYSASYSSRQSVSHSKNDRSESSSSSSKIRVKKNISAVSYMIRLANARTSSQVAMVIRNAKMEAQSLKSLGVSEQEIKSAKKLARRIEEKGTLKKGRLQKEKVLQQREKLEDLADHKKKAAQLSEALQKKVRGRKAQERTDIVNSVWPTEKHQENDQEQVQAYPGSSIDIGIDVTEFTTEAGQIDISV